MQTTMIDASTIRALHPALLRYAQGRVNRADLAEDLVQETWTAAVHGHGAFAGRSTLKTWLVSILRRKIADVHRRKRPQVTFDEEHVLPIPVTPRERLDDHAALGLLRDELERLPDNERAAVRLVDIQLMERAAAADALGVERGHLRVLLHRGRARLKDALLAADHAP